LPIDLRAKLIQTPPTNSFVLIPVEKVLSQLAHGSVKITFGELRAARPGLFAGSGSENDTRQIALPLNEIITRISPTLLSRRVAKKVEAADDVDGPFGTNGQSVNFTSNRAPAKAAPTLPPRASQPAPAPAFPKLVTQPPAPAPRTMATTPRIAPIASIPSARAAATVALARAKPGFSAPSPALVGTIPFSPMPAAPDAGSFNTAPQIPTENPILVPLSALAEKWPDALKMELVQTDLMSAQTALPAAFVETGLKRGRVILLWKNLRMMIHPKPAPVSVHDGVEVELPLKVLTPLFFASQKATNLTKQKASVSEEIPDLFFDSKPTGITSAPVVAPAFTPAPKSPPSPASSPEPKPTPVFMPSATPTGPVPVTPVNPPLSTPRVPSIMPAALGEETISAPLAALSEKWPDALRHEIMEWNLSDAEVALPLNAVAPAMKRGRVTFSWSDLRACIRPTPAATKSVHDNAELELPLKVIAPLFLERQIRPAQPQARLSIDQSIPSPFSSIAPAETAVPVTAPVAAPASAAEPTPEQARPPLKPADAKLSETNYFVRADAKDTPQEDASEYIRAHAPQTDFTSRYATPKEIVARAMTLPGVAGVVVALCDGLTIASQVPSNLNADTAAAFLPQIFDRVAQCTRELRMGPLNNLKFTVGTVPWHIFHVNAIYFAAFGRAGESLPAAQLASLAGELDRKKHL